MNNDIICKQPAEDTDGKQAAPRPTRRRFLKAGLVALLLPVFN